MTKKSSCASTVSEEKDCREICAASIGKQFGKELMRDVVERMRKNDRG